MKRLIILCIVSVTLGLLSPPVGLAQAETVSYENPLAYIGEDGNVYVTAVGVGPGTRLTNDAKMPDPIEKYKNGYYVCSETIRRYGSIRWSPDGTRFAFIERCTGALFVVESGKTPRLLSPAIKVSSWLGHRAIVWSPNGTQIAYATGSPGTPQGVAVIALQDASTHTVISQLEGTFMADGIPPDDMAVDAYFDELGNYMFATSVTLYWTAYGFLYRTGALVLADTKGHDVWHYAVSDTEDYGFSYAVPMSDGRSAFALQYFPGQQKSVPVMIDLPSGRFTPIKDVSINLMAHGYALTPDGETFLYVVTADPGGAVQGDADSEIGKALFDFGWPANGQSYAVTLWRQSLDGGDPVALFTKGGYDIPIISPSPDSTGVALSFMTGSAEMIQKINAQKSRDEILAAFPHPEIYYVNLIAAKPQFIARGGQPAFGIGTFVAVPAD